MSTPTVVPTHAPITSASPDIDDLTQIIEHAAHLLPAQGPITVFIHHNTLHAFEDLPFDEAVVRGMQVFGCQPYLSEDRYRTKLHQGAIRFGDLRVILEGDLRDGAYERVAGLTTRIELRRAMLQYPLHAAPDAELSWFMAETDALRRVRPEASSVVRGQLIAETRRWVMRDLRGGNEASPVPRAARRVPQCLDSLLDCFGEVVLEDWSESDWESFTLQALWRLCLQGVRDLPTYVPRPAEPVRPRDWLLRATGADSDIHVHDVLIRFCAAFLDQGFAHWQLPLRSEGLFRAFVDLYGRAGGPPDRWLRGLAGELRRIQSRDIQPLESIRESLDVLGVAPSEWHDFIASTLLALRGWGGMVRQIELRGDRVPVSAPQGSLVEFLAVRLILDRFALAHVAREEFGFDGPLAMLRNACRRQIAPHEVLTQEQRAFQVFELAQVLGWSPDMLARLKEADWAELVREIESFSGLERRRIFHQAMELRFRNQSLDALALHARQRHEEDRIPRFQAVFCIDEREESMRRHLEELAPDVETLSIAGFFSVAMYYRGVTDAHYVPLCPVVVRPSHWVCEEPADGADAIRRRVRRRALGTASHQFHTGSRTFALGALLSATLGVLASIPLVAYILFPRLTARVRQMLGHAITPPDTRLHLERTEPDPGTDLGRIGFTVEEMANIGERTLRDLGLTRRFARLVLFLGHGSQSLNNPHNSAYNCGACGGAAGGPNARAMAQILNDPRVRARLVSRGLAIPDDTVFVGAFHNTCNDSIRYFDVERIPASHQEEFDVARRQLEETCARNAHERCRRFMSAPLTMSFAQARQHVEERSEDLAQTRPECGHATNALCLVGRRFWTRGLFLDRRAFLTSYDPTQDDEEATILTRILQAVFPVCSGINLEYYFSYVDSSGWGCGTKLPHNITSLLGVMDGAASDLRTGLPWQMVEIHEPVRLHMVIETTPQAMTRIMDRNPAIGRLCRNGWIVLAVQDPDTGTIFTYQDGHFEEYEPRATTLPVAASSVDWYRGWRDHLEFVAIDRSERTSARTSPHG
jgi:uncharacterized protein YbcC (UPF0753/DUF2309 family)